jgi:hypothetical protein
MSYWKYSSLLAVVCSIWIYLFIYFVITDQSIQVYTTIGYRHCQCGLHGMLHKIIQTRDRQWRMVSSWMLHRVALVRTDISEELSASFIRVTRINELGTTLAVTSNRCMLRRNTTWCNIPEDVILQRQNCPFSPLNSFSLSLSNVSFSCLLLLSQVDVDLDSSTMRMVACVTWLSLAIRGIPSHASHLLASFVSPTLHLVHCVPTFNIIPTLGLFCRLFFL